MTREFKTVMDILDELDDIRREREEFIASQNLYDLLETEMAR